MLSQLLINYLLAIPMRTKIPTFCPHRWVHIPTLGTRKYMCPMCHMFGFQIKGNKRIQEHSILVSDDLLEQYLELDTSCRHKIEAKPRGPEPGYPRPAKRFVACNHTWVDAPEFTESESHKRYKCITCGRIGTHAKLGEIQPYSRSHEGDIYRYWEKRNKAQLKPNMEETSGKEHQEQPSSSAENMADTQ